MVSDPADEYGRAGHPGICGRGQVRTVRREQQQQERCELEFLAASSEKRAPAGWVRGIPHLLDRTRQAWRTRGPVVRFLKPGCREKVRGGRG